MLLTLVGCVESYTLIEQHFSVAGLATGAAQCCGNSQAAQPNKTSKRMTPCVDAACVFQVSQSLVRPGARNIKQQSCEIRLPYVHGEGLLPASFDSWHRQLAKGEAVLRLSVTQWFVSSCIRGSAKLSRNAKVCIVEFYVSCGNVRALHSAKETHKWVWPNCTQLVSRAAAFRLAKRRKELMLQVCYFGLC